VRLNRTRISAPEANLTEPEPEGLEIGEEEINGNDCKTSERRAEAEVQQPQAQPMPAVWAATRLSAQVRHLPFVFPVACTQGRDSGRKQIELVRTTVVSEQWSVCSI
jgi:hypothetical protein